MKLFEIKEIYFFPMLPEGKKADWIVKNQGDKLLKVMKQRGEQKWLKQTPEAVALEFENKGGAYAPYLTKLYFSGEIKKIEDLYRMTPLLQTFDKAKRKLAQKDINQYSLAELEKTLEPYMDKMVSKHIDPGVDKQLLDSGTATVVIQTPNFAVWVPHTQEASCELGKGTDWCTAADEDHNMWQEYAREGNLYVIRAGNRRFQLQFESDSFMDEKDNNVSDEDIAYLSKFPEYKTFLETLIKKYHFKEKTNLPDIEPLDFDPDEDESTYHDY